MGVVYLAISHERRVAVCISDRSALSAFACTFLIEIRDRDEVAGCERANAVVRSKDRVNVVILAGHIGAWGNGPEIGARRVASCIASRDVREGSDERSEENGEGHFGE